MAAASASVDIPAPPDRVWQLIGGFGSVSDWNPGLKLELQEGGRVRHLLTPDGVVFVERLMAFDESGRSYSYGILQSPFPQKEYLSTLRVEQVDGGKSARVEWSGTFAPIGVSDTEISCIFQDIYDDGLRALKEHFAREK
jgi:hypothetical protein